MASQDPITRLLADEDVPPLVADYQGVVSRRYTGEDPSRLATVTLDGSGAVAGLTLAPEAVRRTGSEVAAAVRGALAAARSIRTKELVDMGSRHGIEPREGTR